MVCVVLQLMTHKKWSGYGIGFGLKNYIHKNGEYAYNLVIFGVDTNNSSHALVLGKGSIQISKTATIEAKYELKTNCAAPDKKFVLSLHYNSDDSYLFANSIQQYKFKARDTEIKANKVCLGGFSDDFSTNYFKCLGNIYHFSVDYQPTTTDKIQKIHRYLMKEYNIK